MRTTTTDVWTYREGVMAPDVSTRNVVGYGVEATDGSIGKVDEATYEVGSSYLVVDTGPWIFGKKVMLPGGVIRSVDDGEEKIHLDLGTRSRTRRVRRRCSRTRATAGGSPAGARTAADSRAAARRAAASRRSHTPPVRA
jgi:hypothetical protein